MVLLNSIRGTPLISILQLTSVLTDAFSNAESIKNFLVLQKISTPVKNTGKLKFCATGNGNFCSNSSEKPCSSAKHTDACLVLDIADHIAENKTTSLDYKSGLRNLILRVFCCCCCVFFFFFFVLKKRKRSSRTFCKHILYTESITILN